MVFYRIVNFLVRFVVSFICLSIGIKCTVKNTFIAKLSSDKYSFSSSLNNLLKNLWVKRMNFTCCRQCFNSVFLLSINEWISCHVCIFLIICRLKWKEKVFLLDFVSSSAFCSFFHQLWTKLVEKTEREEKKGVFGWLVGLFSTLEESASVLKMHFSTSSNSYFRSYANNFSSSFFFIYWMLPVP